MWRSTKTEIKENWRVCSKCLIFKTWEFFHIDKQNKYWYTPCCKECRNKQKAIYRQTLQWKIMTKNYRIIKRVSPKFREKEKQQYKERASKNRDKRRKAEIKYLNKNRKLVSERRKDLNDFYFSKWKKVYFWKLVWKIKAIKNRKWCFVEFENWMKIRIWKYRLKPFNPVSKSKICLNLL